MESVKPLEIDAYQTPTLAELAPIVEGKPDLSKVSTIDLKNYARERRMQRIVFETAVDVYDQMKPNWKGSREFLLSQLIGIVENFLDDGKIRIIPASYSEDELKKRIIYTLNMNKIVQHIWEAVRFENTESIVPVFDPDYPIRSTGNMRTWYTSKPYEVARKSHINFCVFDRNPHVEAWVKNDHIGFEIAYTFDGVIHKFRPDFIIRLKNKLHLILETKGRDSQKDKTKREFLDEWVKAVNTQGGFGKWAWAVSQHPRDVEGIIEKYVD
jgi:type III restriction enzyme